MRTIFSGVVNAGSPSSWLDRRHYIVSPAFDWAFLIGSPLIAIVVVLGAANIFDPQQVVDYTLVYMAAGHHVPTFIRAYGDADEFERNRFQLTVIPMLVVPLLCLLIYLDSSVLALIVVWDQYHFVRQNYGLMRIYDTKVGAVANRGYNADQWLCFSWFVCICAHSNMYNYTYAKMVFGLGLTPAIWIAPLIQNASLVVAIAVGAHYAVALVSRVASGQPISVPKLLLFASTYGCWYFAYVQLPNVLLSYAISSFFHCLGYNAFAWYYNNRKSKIVSDSPRNSFFRVVHNGRNVWLFVSSILAYGLFSHTGRAIVPGLAIGVNAVSGVLHYYFDSFIWRVRRSDFRVHLR